MIKPKINTHDNNESILFSILNFKFTVMAAYNFDYALSLQQIWRRFLYEIRAVLSKLGEDYVDFINKIDAFITQMATQFKIAWQEEPIDRCTASNGSFEDKNDLMAKQEFKEIDHLLEAFSQMPSRFQMPTLRKPEEPFILDAFILDYNKKTQKYQTYGLVQQIIKPQFKMLSQFVLSRFNQHVKIDGGSRKQLYLPRILKPIIMPYIQQSLFAFVFEVSEIFESSDQRLTSDRFYFFLVRDFLPYLLIDTIKDIVKIQFEAKAHLIKNDVQGIGCEAINECLSRISGPIQRINQTYDNLGQRLKEQRQRQMKLYSMGVKDIKILVRLNSLHFEPINVMILVFYYVICDCKIIIMANKFNRNIISEIIMTLKDIITPLQYVYPIIISSITERHLNFIDSPVPCIVGYWGTDKSLKRVEKKCRQYFAENENNLNLILIDLNNKITIQKYKSQEDNNSLDYLSKQIVSSKLSDQQFGRQLINKLLSQTTARTQNQQQIKSKLKCSQIYQSFLQNNINDL